MPGDGIEPALTPALAQEIATDIGAIIGFHVLITDAEGVVTGSGDQARVGMPHSSSLDVMTTLSPATTTAHQARAWASGMRPMLPTSVIRP